MFFRLSVALAVLSSATFASAQSRPHVYDLQDVNWSVSLDPDQESLTGDVTNTLSPLVTLSDIVLDAGAKLVIDSLTVNGVTAPFKRVGDKLHIALASPALKGTVLHVRILYHGVPEAGAYFVPAKRSYPAHTPIVYTQGEMEDTRQWLPTYDYPDNKSTSEGRIEVPADWIAISNGTLLDVADKGARKIFHWKMDKPHSTYLNSFTAGPFVEGKETWDGIPVTYWVPPGLEEEGKTSFGGTNKIVEFYSKLTHYRYPYSKFTQDVVPDYMFGGMENITAVTQSITTLHPQDTEPIEHSSSLVAHELAHQWFGDTVTCSDWSHTWLNEGWATFLPSFWLRETDGQDAYDLDRYNTFTGGLSAHAGAKRPVVWANYKDPLDMFNNFAYPGGASRMFMLMNMIGEDKFWNAVSSYLQNRQFQNVTTQQFFGDMSKATGKDLKPFMNQWFFTPAAPKLQLSVSGETLTVTQPEPYFNLDTEVWILDFGNWEKKQIHISGPTTTLDLGTMALEPLLIDPECKLMVEIQGKLKLDSRQRIALYKAAPNAGEKARILDTMLDDLDSFQIEKMAKEENFIGLKTRWISRLGNGSSEYLLELLKDPDSRIRNTAAQVIGRQPKSEDFIGAMSSIANVDPNEVVRETALQSELQLTQDSKLAEKAFATDGFKDRYRQYALDWWTTNKPDIARQKCLEFLGSPTSEPLRVNVIRKLGHLKDKPGEREVYQALLKIVSEHSFGARVAAIGALGDYGDRRAIPVLQPLTTHALVFIRQAATGAVSRLAGE
jgi:aminopeptidase N